MKMDNFNRRSNQDKQTAAIQKQIQEGVSDQAEQKEYLDQNLENLNQAFSQMQERIEELDGGQGSAQDASAVKAVVDDVEQIKAGLSKVDASKERQLQNLLQGV